MSLLHLRSAGRRRSGMTLVELLVVLVVLIALAGLLVPILSGSLQIVVGKDTSGNAVSESVQEIGTNATLRTLRDTILGTPGHPGYWNDLLTSQADTTPWPWTMADLFVVPGTLPAGTASYLPTSLQQYNPNTGLGWRGPYIVQQTATYAVNTASGFLPSTPYVYGATNLSTGYGQTGDPGVLDAWGCPIIIQWPSTVADTSNTQAMQQYLYVRLVSAGPNGKIDTALTDTPAVDPLGTSKGDDLVLYLRYVPLGGSQW